MTIKAEIAPVRIGPFTIDGLMAENGEFGIAVPQVADLVKTSRQTASRDIKRLLQKDSKTSIDFQKWKSPFNKKAVNVILLSDFEKAIFELALAGKSEAIRISRALIGLSLHQLFCDAFGQKFEAEDRQQWLVTRMVTRKEFRPLTDQLKAFGFSEPREYAKFVWAFQSKLGIKSGTRDALPIETLVTLQGAQSRLTAFMECGFTPWQALEKL